MTERPFSPQQRYFVAAVLMLTSFAPSMAHAFTVGSGLTRACHEQVTVGAYAQARIQLPDLPSIDPPDGEWEGIIDLYFPNLDASRTERFVLFSLIAGVRSLDTQGHSITNLTSLRGISGERTGQYLHCLRAEEDDFDEGNAVAMRGCREVIRDSLARAANAFGATDPDEIVVETLFALDNYGSFEVDVLAVPYYLGRALHTFQDSFTHSIRTPDLHQIVHVLNFEAPLSAEHDEARDGAAHSGGLDSCDIIAGESGEVVNREVVFAAMEASADMLGAFVRASRSLPMAERSPEIEGVLLKWTRLADPRELGDYDVCDQANDYCDSPWLPSVRIAPAAPTFSCAISRQQNSGHLVWLFAFVALGWRRRRVYRSLSNHVVAVFAITLLSTGLLGCGETPHIGETEVFVLYPLGGTRDESVADLVESGLTVARTVSRFTTEEATPATFEEAEVIFERWIGETSDRRRLIILGSSVYEPLVRARNCQFGSSSVLLVDAPTSTCSNLRSVDYRAYAPAFLAGVAAVSDPAFSPRARAGIVAGSATTPVVELIEGFRAGVAFAGGTSAEPVFVSDDPAVGFSDRATARRLTEEMLVDVDVVFAVAGSASIGVADALEAHLEANPDTPVYFIGSDVDHSIRRADITLGSVLKHIDYTVRDAILEMITGQFSSGDLRVGFADRFTEFVLHPTKAFSTLAGDCTGCDLFEPGCFSGCTTLNDLVETAKDEAGRQAALFGRL